MQTVEYFDEMGFGFGARVRFHAVMLAVPALFAVPLTDCIDPILASSTNSVGDYAEGLLQLMAAAGNGTYQLFDDLTQLDLTNYSFVPAQ